MTLATEILADTPQGFWKLDESFDATTAVDSSGNANNGTYNGVYSGEQGSYYGQKAALFTPAPASSGGVTGITLPNNLGFSAAGLTFEALLNPFNPIGNYQRLIELTTGTNATDTFWAFNSTTGKISVRANSGTEILSTTAIQYPYGGVVGAIPTWYHLMTTVSAAGAVVHYQNGATNGSGTTGNPRTSGSDRTFCRLGQSAYSTDTPLWARGAFFAVYPSVLSAGRVTAHYNAWVADVAAGAVSWGAVATDLGGEALSPAAAAFIYKGRLTASLDTVGAP